MTPSMEYGNAKRAVKANDVRPEIIGLVSDWAEPDVSDTCVIAALLERVCALSLCLSNMLEDGDRSDREAAMMALGRDVY